MKNSKLLCLLLALILALSMALTGCTGDDTPAVTDGNTDSQTSTGDPADGAEDENKNLSLGHLENGVYTNTYAGIGAEFGTGWTTYEASQLQELPDTVTDMMSGSELGEVIANYENIYDMMAENVDDLLSVNVLYTKLKLTDRLAYATKNDEQIMDMTLAQKDMMISAYEQMGMTVKSMQKKEVTFLGEQTFGLYTVAEVNGVACYMLQLFDYHLGAYGFTITLTSYVEDNTENMLSLFYRLD